MQFMKKKNHIVAQFVDLFWQGGPDTVIHEENKHLKCEIWDYKCSVKDSVNSHVVSVHKGKIISNVLTAPNKKDKLKCNSSRKETP